MTNFSNYDNFFEKKDPVRNAFAFEEQLKVNSTLKGNNLDRPEPKNRSFKYTPSSEDYETKLSMENKSNKDKIELLEDGEGFDRLIASFRKLCSNFESNHKKLLK